ncbi:PREDICTED: uncharacterized protein LOC100636949 [Amphimedon queenslandica]|uniref:DSBA-like thioredoxin domain-containing protein n=1 Tax=Amphimedon queenslandica TaxID=400682 RepID=A0A1X7V823_AMPQE|nr:PREDICTED: uncharacterized protein LOC100636949 [Amphimedon queenslandica]|eukprot:XP_003385406.1 PREDICTED: uncharacterized protein LOC100636949 [Amphimedon queenslandica]
MSTKPVEVTVEVTSDVVCPWCWVGKRHLDIALEQVKDEFNVHVRWRPFNLNPWLPEEGMNFKEFAITKFGEDGLKRFTSGQVPFFEKGKAVGLKFNYTNNTRVVPTKKAHILLEYAHREGKQHQLKEKLFGAYYTDGYDISDHLVLGDLLESVGLNKDEGLSKLSDPEYIKHYEEEMIENKRKGISGVPNFELYLSNSPSGVRQSFSGAQPVETFIAVLRRLKLLAKV